MEDCAMSVNDPAFPQRIVASDVGSFHGLTKRELFAAMLMSGMCANSYWNTVMNGSMADSAAAKADALIAVLEKSNGK